MNHGAMKQSVCLPFADSRVQHGYPGQQKYLGQARMSQFLQLFSIVGMAAASIAEAVAISIQACSTFSS